MIYKLLIIFLYIIINRMLTCRQKMIDVLPRFKAHVDKMFAICNNQQVINSFGAIANATPEQIVQLVHERLVAYRGCVRALIDLQMSSFGVTAEEADIDKLARYLELLIVLSVD